MVPEVGIEPTRGRPRWILSPVRLPVSPLRRENLYIAYILLCSQAKALEQGHLLLKVISVIRCKSSCALYSGPESPVSQS